MIFNQNPHIRVGQQKAYFIERDGLFWFKHSAEETNMSALSIDEWHARFSHAYCETLKKPANQAVKVISGSLAIDRCTTCSEFKISTSYIPKNLQIRATRKFELVQSDVCGPFPESLHGNKYAISFIDDFSRQASVCFMASKGDSLAKLQLFLITVIQSYNVTGFTLSSDNVGESISRKFQNFCKNNSIAQQFTSPYSPHQNGIAKRCWRTVLTMHGLF